MTVPSHDMTGSGERLPSRRGYRAWLRTGRFPVLLVATLVVMAGLQEVTVLLTDSPVVDLLVGAAASVATLWLYTRMSKFVERRTEVPELGRDRAWSGLVLGCVIGAGAFVLTMLLITLFADVRIGGGGEPGKLIGTLGVMATAAATEEVVFRGVVLRIVEERLGSWLALVISAVLFGLMHLAGSSQTSGSAELWGTTAIVVQGGLLFGAAYLATRSLWLPIAIHFAWNMVESGFGTAVSGKTSEFGSLVRSTLSGPTWLTGGSFGPEAGWAAIFSCVLAAALMLWYAKRHGGIVRRGDTAHLRATLR